MNLKEGFCIFIDTVHYSVFCLHPSKPFGRMVAPSLQLNSSQQQNM